MRERLSMPKFWACGLAMLAVELLLRLSVMKDGFFWQDDFTYLHDVRSGLSLSVMFQDYNGHLMPGAFLLSFLVSALGSSWGWAVMLLLGLQAAAGAALLWVTALLFRGHPASLLVYAVAIYTPLTLVGSMWFAYGLQLWPQQLATCLALGCFIRCRQTHAVKWAGGVLGALVTGLFFWEKGVLILPVLLLFAVLVLDRGVTWRQRLLTLWAEWRLWIPMVAITAGYLVLYLSRTSSSLASPEGDRSSLGTLFENGVVHTLLPGLLGGPWTSSGSNFTLSATPNDVVTAVVVLTWLAVIGGSFVWRGRRAGGPWLWALFAVIANYGLLLSFRAGAVLLARDTRYVGDIVPILALAVGLAFLPSRAPGDEAQPARSDEGVDIDRPGAAAAPEITTGREPTAGIPLGPSVSMAPLRVAVAVAVFVAASVCASSWVSTRALDPSLKHTWSRAFADVLHAASKADPDRPMLEHAAPFTAVYFGSQRELATGLRIPLHWVSSGRDLTMVDQNGRIGQVSVPIPTFRKSGPIQGCGWLVKHGQPARIDIGDHATYGGVLALGVMSRNDVALRLRFDDGLIVHTSTGADGLAVITATLNSRQHSVTVQMPTPDQAVCVTDAAVGAPGVK